MALKLHLLSGKAIEKQKKNEYQKYQIGLNKIKFFLSNEQQKAFKELITNLKIKVISYIQIGFSKRPTANDCSLIIFVVKF